MTSVQLARRNAPLGSTRRPLVAFTFGSSNETNPQADESHVSFSQALNRSTEILDRMLEVGMGYRAISNPLSVARYNKEIKGRHLGLSKLGVSSWGWKGSPMMHIRLRFWCL